MDTPHEPDNHRGPPRPDVLRAREARENEVPASVAFDALIASDGNLAVFVSGLKVFSNGMELTVDVRLRAPRGDTAHELSMALHQRTQLLVGVEFADGRRGSNISDRMMSGPTDAPTFWPGAGQAGGRSASSSLFLSPLPPPGELRLVFAWPARGIQDTIVSLPSAGILDAARRVIQLWPWEPEEYEEREPARPDIPDGSWFAAEVRHG